MGGMNNFIKPRGSGVRILPSLFFLFCFILNGGCSKEKVVVGRKEKVYLPCWGLKITAKIDTGAKTSSIHAYNIEKIGAMMIDGEEKERIRFTTRASKKKKPVTLEATVIGYKLIKSSAGRKELRPVVETILCLGPVRKKILLSLANRQKMIFKMLLGRDALGDDFIVDPAKKKVNKLRKCDCLE